MKEEEEVKISEEVEKSETCKVEKEVSKEKLDLKATEVKEETTISEESSKEQEKVIEPEVLEIYTDGACSGNPGIGGYGAILIWGDNTKEVSGGEKLTTNNKMELMGAIQGLKSITNTEVKVKIYTDSTYVQKGMTEWIENWKRKNFKDVKNVELWKELDDLNSKLNIEWHWVKAHAGNKYNEMADALAKSEITKIR